MKTLKNTRTAWLAAVCVALLWFCGGRQSIQARDFSADAASRALGIKVYRQGLTDAGVPIRIQYTGTQSAGLARVSVDAAGDLFFFNDAGSADTTVSTDGQIDVSGSAENTWGEVADAINLSANWAAILQDALPSVGCNDVLTSTTVAGDLNQVYDADGYGLLLDTSDADYHYVRVGPEYLSKDVLTVPGTRTHSGGGWLLNRRAYPIGGLKETATTWNCEAHYLTVTPTYSSTAPVIRLVAVRSDGAGSTEIELLRRTATTSGSANTIALPTSAKFGAGWAIVACLENGGTTALTAVTYEVHGRIWRYVP